MKPKFLWLVSFMFCFSLAARAQANQLSGDIWKWIPFDSSRPPKDSQVVRNTQYVSIKIEAAHASYRSGFLENIRQIVVSSSVSFDFAAQKVQAMNVNRTWQRPSSKSEDDIPVNDLLAVLSPASPSSISIKMQYAGLGDDRFKGVFDILSNSDVKTALNLSQSAIAQSSLATSIVQRFLATPYTSANPKDVLSMSQGFVIYSNRDADRVDSLRQGYIVVVSGTEKKGAGLNDFVKLGSDSLRFDTGSHVLQTKQADGSWLTFAGNSYVVLSVTVDSVRGTDENSAWFKKFSDADRATEALLTGQAADKAKKNAIDLWQEGTTLLSADANYIEAERKAVRLKWLQDIQDHLKKNGASSADAELASAVGETPANVMRISNAYQQQVKQANVTGSVRVRVIDPTSRAGIAGVPVDLRNENTGKVVSRVTDASGNVTVPSLNSGTYSATAKVAGATAVKTADIVIQPRQNKDVSMSPGFAK